MAGSNTPVEVALGYTANGDATSTQVSAWNNALGSGVNRNFAYTYDDKGNILSVSDGSNTTSYVYDHLNQLTRENNQAAGKTWTYSYDSGGNITAKTQYAYTTGALGAPLDTAAFVIRSALQEWRKHKKPQG